MSFVNQNDIVNYSYITTLYTKLNTARKKFGFSNTTSSGKSQYDTHTASDITRLHGYINEMSSNTYLKTVAKISNPPTQYETYIIPDYFNAIYNKIEAIQNTCNHNPCDCNCNCNCNCNCDCKTCSDCRNCYDGLSTCTLNP